MNIRQVLAQLNIEPKKSLGQNFMVTPGALTQMADAASVDAGDAVMEIGAGLGALTEILAARAGRVVAVEIDERFVPYLRDKFAGMPHVEIVEADVLAVDVAALMGEDAGAYKVVANLPYYITSAIIRRLLESPTPPQALALTVQAEVAERVTAGPGDMSLLAVSVQFYGVPKLVTRLKAGTFYPRPNVDSAILRVTPRPGWPPLPPDEAKAFFQVVRAGFSQKRKQLKNSLAAALHVPTEDAASWLERAGIDPRRRAETLALDEWLAVYRAWDV